LVTLAGGPIGGDWAVATVADDASPNTSAARVAPHRIRFVTLLHVPLEDIGEHLLARQPASCGLSTGEA
jgi:hypothetical protein